MIIDTDKVAEVEIKKLQDTYAPLLILGASQEDAMKLMGICFMRGMIIGLKTARQMINDPKESDVV